MTANTWILMLASLLALFVGGADARDARGDQSVHLPAGRRLGRGG